MNVYISDLIEEYNTDIDDNNPVVTIGSMEFIPSVVLKEMDYTAYRIGFYDWLDYVGIDCDDEGIIWNVNI